MTHRSFAARAAAGLLVLALAAVPALAGNLGAIEATTADADAHFHDALMQAIGRTVAGHAAVLFGDDSRELCVVTDALAACVHPSTPPERLDEILRSLPTWTGDKYVLGTRWSITATDGSVGTNEPVTITYSFLDDGVYIPGADEPGSASSLYAEMNSHFGSPAVWKPIFAGIFNDWGKHVGITYVEVSDDGAAFPTTAGELGLRGDVRIGAHNIDGYYNVLAYNYFPNIGDMVLDTSENWGSASNNYRYMRNICRHEHGHGMGLQHVSPTNCQKLMEPYACTNFDGPQDDDIRGAMRLYGDTYEFNNTAASATDLGYLDGVFSPEFPVSLTTSVDYDYWKFSTAGPAELSVTVTPVGSTYLIDSGSISTDQIIDVAFRVLGGSGSDVLTIVNDNGLGAGESVAGMVLPDAGDYWVLVYRAAGTPDVQRYDLTIDVTPSGILAVDDGLVPVRDLGLRVFPNPFNPMTTARFYAPAAGAVTVGVYDLAGKLVRRLDADADAAGWMELTWDGRDRTGRQAPSGMYLLRAAAAGRTQTERVLMVE